MADSNTTNYSLVKPEVGASEDTWGTKLNQNLDTIDTKLDDIEGKSGAATLKHTNSTKLQTTATGVDVTGTVTADGLTVDGDSTVDAIELTTSSSFPTTGLTLNANGFSYEMTGSQGKIFRDAGNNKALMYISGQNDLHLYEDTGTTAKFVWDSSAERLGIGTSSPASDLHISSSTAKITLTDSDVSRTSEIYAASDNLVLAADTGNAGADSHIRFEVDNSEKMRIDSSGNVGIGTASPSGELHVKSASANANLYLQRSIYTPWRFSAGSSYLAFNQDSSEKARIDSSGNLLVGGTSLYQQNAFTFRNDGWLYVRRDSNTVQTLRRDGTDGHFITFDKEGSTVGSIGTNGDDLLIANGNTGIRLWDAEDAIIPRTSGGATHDALTDLGQSAHRFKDLYLSGGVYLGGTGSANKLDDYETGTFTPTLEGSITNPSVSYGTRQGDYVKIGKQVTAWITLTGTITSAGNGAITITGLPFPIRNSSGTVGSVWIDPINQSDAGKQLVLYVPQNTTNLRPYFIDVSGTSGDTSAQLTHLTSSLEMRFQVNYITD